MTDPKSFEILGHTADLRLRVIGKTKEELFRHALQGMAEIIKKEEHGGRHPAWPAHRDIAVESPDENALLVDFLNEVLYLTSVNHAVYRDITIWHLSEKKIEGELLGEAAENFDEDIKAVTYHEAKIRQRPDGYFEATLVCDI